MTVSKPMIEDLLKKLNAAENSRPNGTVEETVAAVDAICAPDFQGRMGNEPFHDRETERQMERALFAVIPDYHRTITKAIIDPPFAAIEWAITGTARGQSINVPGCSVLEIDGTGLLKSGTVYLDTAQSPPLV